MPEPTLPRLQRIGATIFLCLLPCSLANAARPTSSQPASPAIKLKVRPDDGPTREGFERFYNSDYEGAIQNFEKTLKAHPDDAFAMNHVLEAVLFREIDREGSLNGELYLGTEFLHSKRAAVDADARARIQELTKQSLSVSEERLKAKPDDVDALYARGITRSLSAIYEGLVEKAWYTAFRDALGAYDDHKRVLELVPSYNDAKLVVGVYVYVASALPIYERVVAFMFNIRGGKAEGIASVREAANAGGEASVDAKTALSLFLAREHEYSEAIALVRELYAAYPHNFHYGLSEADVLRNSGKIPEAVASYRDLLALGQRNEFAGQHIERAAIGLGRALHLQGDVRGAANAFDSAGQMAGATHEMATRANLQAGEMYDLLHDRVAAKKRYEAVLAAGDDSMDAREAKRFLKDPYRDP